MKDKKSSKKRPSPTWAVGLLFAAWAMAIYWPSLDAPLYLDDYTVLRDGSGLSGGETPPAPRNRPLAVASFILVRLLFGDSPIPQRALNVLIHALAALGVFLLARELGGAAGSLPGRTGGSKNTGGRRDLFALAAASLWMASPALSQSVVYLVQRMTALSGAFTVWALYYYVKSRTSGEILAKRPIALCAFLWLLALGTKETAVLLPLFALILEGTLLRPPGGFRETWRQREIKLLFAAAAAVFSLAAFLYLYTEGGGGAYARMVAADSHLPARNFTAAERLLTMPRIVIFYVSLLLWPEPSRLSLEHDPEVSRGLLSPPSTLAALLLLLLFVLYALRVRRRRPLVAAGSLLFLAGLSLESGPLNLELVFEHRLYLPSVGLILAVSAAFAGFSRRSGFLGKAAGVVLAVLLIIFSVGTALRGREWTDPEGFWRKSLARAPASPRPYTYLAQHLEAEGRGKEALPLFEKAARLGPRMAEVRYNLGLAYLNRERWAEAAGELEAAVGLAEKPATLAALGKAYEVLGRPREAEAALEKALDLAPRNAQALGRLGNFLLRAGRSGEALFYLEKAAESSPRSAVLQNNLGAAYRRLGRPGAALEAFGRAARAAPDSPEYLRNLGAALQGAGRLNEAIRAYREALSLDPTEPRTLRNLATALMSGGKDAEAAAILEKIVERHPGFGEAWENLAAAYYRLGRPEKALGALEGTGRAGREPDPRIVEAVERALKAR